MDAVLAWVLWPWLLKFLNSKTRERLRLDRQSLAKVCLSQVSSVDESWETGGMVPQVWEMALRDGS